MKNWLLIFAFSLVANSIFGQWKFSFLAGTAANWIERARDGGGVEYYHNPETRTDYKIIAEKRRTGLGLQFGVRLSSPARKNFGVFAEFNLHRIRSIRTTLFNEIWVSQNEVVSSFDSKTSLYSMAYSIPIGFRFGRTFWGEFGAVFRGNVYNLNRKISHQTVLYTFNNATNTYYKLNSPTNGTYISDVNSENALGFHFGICREFNPHFSLIFRYKEMFDIGDGLYYYLEPSRRLTTLELTAMFSNFTKKVD